MLIAYFVLLLSGTVLIRTSSPGDHFQPELFWSWKQWTIQKNQIFTNVIMFLPVGVLAGSIWRWKGLWVATGLSVLIEVLQLITARGLCEFDDVIHNCIGALIGIGIMMLVKDLVEMIRVSSSD